ncbi:MAG TPA: aspartyl protease family protein [Saprospiraceae bacterium]|nr:aspartyl protease family protein [Saprospiraceae bacterium]
MNDTIPFTIKDNRIYFQGKINGSELLNIQFDLGADAVNINKKSVKKIKINFDRKGNLVNSDGTNETRVSSNNQVEIAGLVWNNIEMYETKNMENYEDVIIGNSFFLDQIYEIDYDKNIIIIYDNLPKIEPDFVKQDMILDNGVRPVFEASFSIEGKIYKDWFLFDTGNTSNGILGNGFLKRNNLYDKFSTILGFGSKKIAFIPQLIIANQTISEGVITLEKPNTNGSKFKFSGIIGNKILKRFNVIIDNREGYIYLKPNFFLRKKISE